MQVFSRAAHAPAYLLWLTLVVIMPLMSAPVANGHQPGMALGDIQDEPVSPTNFPLVFTRVIGTDVWRSSVGGLRNVGSGTISLQTIHCSPSRAAPHTTVNTCGSATSLSFYGNRTQTDGMLGLIT